MGRLIETSKEEAGPYASGKGGIARDGWRKSDSTMMTAKRLADAGAAIQAEKRTAIVAVKRVGAQIGLKAADLLLLDTLAAFSPPQDWEQGRRPIVWASNAYLMEQTGFSLSTLKRHARRLAESGLIAFKDSPNGKRWGHRNRKGHIVEAYGFDLSPLAARQAEFADVAEMLQAERVQCQHLKRQITVTRRMIRAKLDNLEQEELSATCAPLNAQFEDLLLRLPKGKVSSTQLEYLLSSFEDLQERIEHIATPAPKNTEVANLNPLEANSDPHIPTTIQLKPSSCNENDGAEPRPTDHIKAQNKDMKTENISLNTIKRACPEFIAWIRSFGLSLATWADAPNIIDKLRPMIGITDSAWGQAQAQLGKFTAILAFALTFEKHCAGEVTSPNGYLQGMVQKAKTGQLHLQRSFYGRLSRALTPA